MLLTTESSTSSSLSKTVGIFIFLFLVLSLPLTIHLLQSTQSNQQYATVKCINRPTCLDAAIPCKIPEPKNGWCPVSVTPSIATPTVLPTQSIASPTARPVFCTPLPSCYFKTSYSCPLIKGVVYCSPSTK